MTFDIGIIATGAVVMPTFVWGRGRWLRHLLLVSWLTTTVEWIGHVRMATTIATMASLDLLVAGAALAVFTHDNRRRDAQIVGALSMCMMPAHWVAALTRGAFDWTLYASAANAVFVAQCFILLGWFDGLARRVRDFVGRHVHIRRVRGRG